MVEAQQIMLNGIRISTLGTYLPNGPEYSRQPNRLPCFPTCCWWKSAHLPCENPLMATTPLPIHLLSLHVPTQWVWFHGSYGACIQGFTLVTLFRFMLSQVFLSLHFLPAPRKDNFYRWLLLSSSCWKLVVLISRVGWSFTGLCPKAGGMSLYLWSQQPDLQLWICFIILWP